ncbi:MAG: hypothetical protein EOO20_25080 [Chryseobacterium sp.]|nr:MAG: hypothetical protein EOO20_25080 [Chryseobacterium sp.]
MKIAIVIISFLIISNPLIGQSFYSNNGRAILFYEVSNGTLFDYSGKPKFYFKYESQKTVHIYDFTGVHVGWLFEGIIRDHNGRILASQAGRIANITYAIEPIKPVQQIVPIKGVAQIPPIQPVFKNEFSNIAVVTEETGLANLGASLPPSANFRPYQLPADEIYNALDALNRQHNRLIAQGYIYDARTDKYYTKEQFAPIEANRRAVSQSFFEMAEEAKRFDVRYILFKKPKKKTLYWVYIGNAEMGVYSAKVMIKRNGKIRGFYFNHPRYGYMFFGAYKKAKVQFPFQDILYIGDVSKYKRREVGALGSAFERGVMRIFYHKGFTKVQKK